MIVFLTLLPPALFETTLKVALAFPGLFCFSLTLTVLVVPAEIFPTDVLKLTPLPFSLSLTPVASASPELVILTLLVAVLPFFALAGPLSLTLLIAAWVGTTGTTVSTVKVLLAGV